MSNSLVLTTLKANSGEADEVHKFRNKSHHPLQGQGLRKPNMFVGYHSNDDWPAVVPLTYSKGAFYAKLPSLQRTDCAIGFSIFSHFFVTFSAVVQRFNDQEK